MVLEAISAPDLSIIYQGQSPVSALKQPHVQDLSLLPLAPETNCSTPNNYGYHESGSPSSPVPIDVVCHERNSRQDAQDAIVEVPYDQVAYSLEDNDPKPQRNQLELMARCLNLSS